MGLAETFPIASERLADRHWLAPAGELDIATVPLLEAAFDDIERGDATKIVVDLSGITFIDSTGIQLLLRMNERCNGDDRLEIVASTAVERLLDITGLRDQLPLASGGAQAS
jgi:anti-sigma B factor antagonist